MSFPDCIGLQLQQMKFYSSMWARNVTNAFIPSLSHISLNVETSSLFIIGGHYDIEKVRCFANLSICGKFCGNFILSQ